MVHGGPPPSLKWQLQACLDSAIIRARSATDMADLRRRRIMSFLRKFTKEVLGKSPDGKPRAKDSSAVDAGKAPSSGGLINPFAEDEKSVKPDGGKTPAPGGLINPFAEDEPAAPEAQAVHSKMDAAPAEDGQAQAKKFFEEADALYKKKQYAKAAEQYRLAYRSANGDQRGAIAFNVAQALRLSNSFPSAAVWYQKALTLGGPTVSKYRDAIEQRVT